MLLERYEYEIGITFQQYDFYSEGPKGKIRKAVLYSFLGTVDGSDYYNLGFGDYDEKGTNINDLSVSDNKDRDRVLATVAVTAIEFTNHFPGSKIVAEGSTPSRTRLYQMGIAKHYKEIAELFDIQGLTEKNGWVAFKAGENYLALLVAKK
jgi:hypothetical protein